MGTIDSIINSSLTIYIVILLFILHFYLKKTGQTFPDLIKRIREAIQDAREKND